MIELAFGDSFAGSLKMAKSIKQGESLSSGASAIGIIGGTRKEQRKIRKEWRKARNARFRIWSGKTMEDCSGDVAALTLVLNIGDISDMAAGMNGRKMLLDKLFKDYFDVFNEMDGSNEIWETNQKTLMRLAKAK
jgi:hypothetical protein